MTAAPAFTELRLSTGVRLHCALQGPERGPAVLFLHGVSDSWFSFSRVLPLLPAHWRCVAPDQRGQGESERPAAGYDRATPARRIPGARLVLYPGVGHAPNWEVPDEVAAELSAFLA
jgi:pimeloyl-ACP methyl ester carboxylesterase